MTFTLRDYQQEAVDSIRAAWERGLTRPVVLCPTGGGKTVIFSSLICETLPVLRAKGERVLVLAHREELLEQAKDKITKICPDAVVGIVKGARDESRWADVVVASIQTLDRPKRREALGRIGMVIVDEAHMASPRNMYRKVMEHYGCFDSTPTVGFTATLTRMDGGLAEIWEEVCFERSIGWMIEEGHLVPARGLSVQVDSFNLANTRVTAGDLNVKDVSEAMMNSDAFRIIADSYVEHAKDRAGIVFMPDVATASAMVGWFTRAGIAAELIVGSMTSAEKRETYSRYNLGATQILVSVMVLTTGFDAPHTSCVVIARPTLNPGLFQQMVGRGLRLADGKDDCLVIDVSGAAQRHTLAGVNDLAGNCTSKCGCECLKCGCTPRSTRIVRNREIPISGKCKCRKDGDCGCACTSEHKRPEGKECPCSSSPECGCDPDCQACAGCIKEPAAAEPKEVSLDDLVLTEIQLLDQSTEKSRFTWLTTKGGVRFLSVGEDYLVVVPEVPGGKTYMTGVTGPSGGRKLSVAPMTPAGAVALAERHADAIADQLSRSGGKNPYNMKSGSWRRTPASEKQKSTLSRMGITLPEGAKKGEAADLLTIRMATRALDRRFARFVQQS